MITQQVGSKKLKKDKNLNAKTIIRQNQNQIAQSARLFHSVNQTFI